MAMKTRPLERAGFVLGIGLGGFADGIILHQLFQWHHMVCTTATCEVHTLAEFKRQTFQDGLFHLAMWLAVIGGVAMLFRALAYSPSEPRGRNLVGSIFVGWGCFNLVEGIVNHHVLGIHHVISGSPHQLTADFTFLAVSLLLAVVGWTLCGSERKQRTP